jgi:hypothetical protein
VHDQPGNLAGQPWIQSVSLAGTLHTPSAERERQPRESDGLLGCEERNDASKLRG